MHDLEAELFGKPLCYELAVAPLRIALDAEQGRGGVRRHLGDDRREIDVVDDLPCVALDELGV